MAELANAFTRDEIAMLGNQLCTLRSSAQIKHKNGSLLTHLAGVWRVLRTGGAPRELAAAGLIHSAYSTQFFKTRIFEPSDRQKVAKIYGEYAEHLAWLFCRINRPLLWEIRPHGGFLQNVIAVDYESQATIRLDAKIANALFTLECANFIDQGYSDQSIGAFHAWALALTRSGVALEFRPCQSTSTLSERYEEVAIKYYSSSQQDSWHLENLKRASQYNPFAAEPLILSALVAGIEGKFSQGMQDLTRARRCLPIFGTSWDKRLSWPEWRAVTDAVEESIRQQKCPNIAGDATNLFIVRDWAFSGEIL